MKKTKDKIVGVCCLCKEVKELLSKSHILPKFFLRQVLTKDNPEFAVISFDASEVKYVSDYGYEPGILCADCDNKKLSKYEDYGSKFLFGSLGKNALLRAEARHIHYHIENVNYHRLKLFFLTILWRCSIASSNNYHAVKLDQEIEEEIRLILLNDEFVPETKYPIALWNYVKTEDIPKEIILPPWIGNIVNGEQNFHFIGGGLLLQLIIRYNSLVPINEETILKESGIIKIVDLPSEPLKAMINKLVGWKWLN